MPTPIVLSPDVTLRLITADDAAALAAAYRRNRRHLAPWEPERNDDYFTEDHQRSDTRQLLDQYASGSTMPLVLSHGTAIVGRLTISGIVRGAFQSGNIGYWVDAQFCGRGLATASVRSAIAMARDDLALHRLQAATLLHNIGSQRALERAGFERIGHAPLYLNIAGQWQDHVLFQAILHS
jgi:ribosomal-protein-alanine N-acetyltransferase